MTVFFNMVGCPNAVIGDLRRQAPGGTLFFS